MIAYFDFKCCIIIWIYSIPDPQILMKILFLSIFALIIMNKANKNNAIMRQSSNFLLNII